MLSLIPAVIGAGRGGWGGGGGGGRSRGLVDLRRLTGTERLEEGAGGFLKGTLVGRKRGSHCGRSACVNIQVNEAQWA